jgi:superfamily II DNA or RNA helicase
MDKMMNDEQLRARLHRSNLDLEVKFTTPDRIPIYINKKGAYCKLKEINPIIEKKIMSGFTIRNKNIMGFFDVFKCYSHTKINGERVIVFPRFGALLLAENKKLPAPVKFIPLMPPPKAIEFETNAGFVGNQELVFNAIFEYYFSPSYLKKEMGGVIIELDAGAGKTVLAILLLARLKLRTLIIVHNQTILSQWKDELAKFAPDVDVGLFYGKKKDMSSDVIISVINSALKFPNFDDFGVVIFDECHMYSSKEFSKIFQQCQSRYMIGLSATPEIKKESRNNLYKVIQWNIGPILKCAELEGYVNNTEEFKARVIRVMYYAKPEYSETLINEKLGVVSNSKMLNQLTTDPYRMELIIHCIMEIMRHKQKLPNGTVYPTYLFVFADRRDYLTSIHENLTDEITDNVELEYLTNDDEFKRISTLLGGSKAGDVEHAKANSYIIFSTYKFMGTGYSIPRMNAILFATPFKTGSKQFAGRIFRTNKDNPEMNKLERLIFDICDMNTTLTSQYYARKKYYLSCKFPIKEKKLSWTDFADDDETI